MTTHHPALARGGNLVRIPLHVGEWHDDEHTIGISMSERHRTHRRLSENHLRMIGYDPFTVYVRSPREVTFHEFWNDPDSMQDELVTTLMPTALAEALQELEEVSTDATEDGLEMPSQVAFTTAERLLKAMYRISPRRFVVYPVSGGRIAIDARGPNDRIAVLTCDSDGGALCLVTIDGESRRARYSTARQLPDGFIREALAALDAKLVL